MKKKFNVNVYQSPKKDMISPFIVNNLRFVLFPYDNAVTSSIIEGWQYEFYMFDFLKKNYIETIGTDIIDVGANNGNFAVDFAHLVGDEGRVFSFEPQRIIFQQLCANVFINGLDNVYTYNCAVGDTNKKVKLEKPDYHDKKTVNFGNVAILEEVDSYEWVETKRLDDFEFKNVSFIKIDVQGYEPFVIEGAKETISKHRPYLFVEFEDHMLIPNGSSDELLKKQIEALGYEVMQFQNGIPYQTKSGKCLDCVCIPLEKEPHNHIVP
jgi:FkbM family methyltransferase